MLTQAFTDNAASAAASTCSAYPAAGVEVAAAQGVWVRDHAGRRFLDACAGTFNISLGYAHPEVSAAVRRVLDRGFLHGSGYLHTADIREAEVKLASIAPAELDRCHLKGCTGGSTAIEQAVRHAWAVNGRPRVAFFENSHHGQTVLTTGISGMSFRKKRIPAEFSCHIELTAPDCYRCPVGKTPESCRVECADLTVSQLHGHSRKAGVPTALVAEPISGAGGGVMPPEGYWSRVTDYCRSESILVIADEIQTFGRTGTFFASDTLKLAPDMIAVAKGISGIGVPAAGALLLPQRLAILEDGERSLTWGGSAMAAAAICATISVMQRPGFFENLKAVAKSLRERLDELALRFPWVGCVRGTGLMTGLEIVTDKTSRRPCSRRASRVVAMAKEHGLLLRQSQYNRGSFVKVRPALNITPAEANELCDRLEAVLHRTNADE